MSERSDEPTVREYVQGWRERWKDHRHAWQPTEGPAGSQWWLCGVCGAGLVTDEGVRPDDNQTVEQFASAVTRKLDVRGFQRAVAPPATGSHGVIWVERHNGQMFTVRIEPGWRD